MSLFHMVFQNQLFFKKKVFPIIFLSAVIAFIPVVSLSLINHIKLLAEKPLESLQTELILQSEKRAERPEQIKTSGVILPFDLGSFSTVTLDEKLGTIPEIANYSKSLNLWQRDLQTNRLIVGIDKNDPLVGMRKIETFLMKNGQFFSSNSADEVILELHFARIFSYKLHGHFDLFGKKLKIVGLIDFKNESNLNNASIFLPYETAKKVAGIDEKITNQVFISLKSSNDVSVVTKQIEARYPGFSLITKDSLLKNLSAFNQMIYSSGFYFILFIFPLAACLLFWVLMIYRKEFKGQIETFKVLGWPKRSLQQWVFFDVSVILGNALLLTLLFSVALQFFILGALEVDPLLDQGFKL